MLSTYQQLTFEQNPSRVIGIRFSQNLGKQYEVSQFETDVLTFWLLPFEHVEGAAPPSITKKRKVVREQ
jgi:hypothetical protein